MSVQTVFPDDNRVQYDPTDVAPACWVAYVSSTFPSGAVLLGTGTLVAPDRVLTCAHALHCDEYGGRARSVEVTLALNGGTAPFGPPVPAREWQVPEEYRLAGSPYPPGQVLDATRYIYDFGLITLSKPLDPARGLYPEIVAAPDQQLRGAEVNIAGYPGDKTPGTMWNGSGKLPAVTDPHLLFYRISTFPGQSGAAIRMASPPPKPTFSVVGIHVAGFGDEANFAVRINTEVYAQIMAWMPATDGARLAPAGLAR
ncbi:trypsin-like peptidase domain-containing protein [Dactylosporangium aurantiacum]|uniref:Serine protease n=1 Tax=Dactylosporangium aurantiacum TaxID=35754 RepID=A0A9Q9MB25_9ACTN|nr:trypsin-like peptidase domain-containing protein [Dactylosporangium aurantiacum]MDG6101725.1 trypsin-like peptidase domain-containing protein [Dactylosporangium aurantiacum]UWZ52463.1 trypsin-like peptidase domain-containing protein [Dactylosporangium aurantiacum]